MKACLALKSNFTGSQMLLGVAMETKQGSLIGAEGCKVKCESQSLFTALSEISKDLERLAGDVSLLRAVLCGWVPVPVSGGKQPAVLSHSPNWS